MHDRVQSAEVGIELAHGSLRFFGEVLFGVLSVLVKGRGGVAVQQIEGVCRARMNRAGYTTTPVACGWAGAIVEVTSSFGQEQ